MLFADKLRSLRESNGLPQRVVAEMLGIDIPMYSRMERGERPIRREQIAVLAKALNVKESDLLTLWLADQVADVMKDDKELINEVMDIAKGGMEKMEVQKQDKEELTFIDLFAGIGGFHQAMKSFGGKCVFACDIDPDCRKTYELNYCIKPSGDITKIKAADIPSHDLLCAGFPCQSFSKAGKRLGFEDETKGTLFFDVCRILEYHRPKYVLLENVRNLASHDHGNTWRVIHDKLVLLGYDLLPEPVIFSPHYIGIPQHRERVYIMCIRKDIGTVKPFIFDKNKAVKCSIESILQDDNEIENIDRYKISSEVINLIDLWNEFLQNIKTDKLPSFPIWSDRLCDLDHNEDLSQYPIWKQNFILKNNELYISNRKFVDKWLKKAHSNPIFFGAKAKLEWQAGQTDKPDIWKQIFQFRPSGIRIKVNTYFPALVAIVQTSIVGPRRRFLTPRECARLQCFPEDFIPDKKMAQAYKQFGNAVNVKCTKLFLSHILE